MVHTAVTSLMNDMTVSVVTNVNVKSRPTVALSDDVVSVEPETNEQSSH